MRRSILLFAALALTLAAVGCSKAAAPVDKQFGEQVRSYLLEHPEVIEEVADKLQAKRQAAADAMIKSSLSQNRAAIERDRRDFVAGNPNGKVTVVEFFDYRCPYCKAAMADINKLIAANKDVRFVLKEYPILSPTSEIAARVAMGAKAQGKYFEVHEAMMKEKNLDEAAIDRILVASGVDAAKARAVGDSSATAGYLSDTKDLARKTGVTGTPAFLIGDKLIAGWSMDQVQAAIADARKGA
jgi:protein-disulfide isomerase